MNMPQLRAARYLAIEPRELRRMAAGERSVPLPVQSWLENGANYARRRLDAMNIAHTNIKKPANE
jgi:hypothetical protein